MPVPTGYRPQVRRPASSPAFLAQNAKMRRFIEHVEERCKGMTNRLFADMYRTSIHRKVLDGDNQLFEFMSNLERPIVSIEEFLDSGEFLGATDLIIWPEVRQAIIDINANWWKGVDFGAHSEAVLMGATGTGKSTIIIVSIAYHTYILSCIKTPQNMYGLPKATSIVFPLMGAKPHVVNKVVYAPLRKLIEAMPYFQKYMPPSKHIDSEIYFEEKNIRIVKAGGDEDAILGEAVIGGGIDEINFMQVVQRSKKAEVSTGRAGLYDQAENIHHRMVSRKKGRFQRPGSFPMIGIIFPSSSTRYKGDFTDKRKAFKHQQGKKAGNIYIYERKQYEVAPAERYCGETFRLVIGNEAHHDTRVLKDDEVMPPGAWVENVPIEYLEDFLNKPYDSLRDVLGISSNALSPFIKQRTKVLQAVEAGLEMGLQSFLLKDNVILGVDGMPQVIPGHYCANPSRPRYVHVDLSRNGDRCGISMVRFDGMVEVARKNGMREKMPVGVLEMACSIEPDAVAEIDVAEVRSFVKMLKTRYGYPIRGVSYDNVDSRESIQAWRKQGMPAAQFSVDRTDNPYKQFRDAIYDGRMMLLDNPVLITEILDLEHDEKKGKVDHPVHGSKDIADSACAAYACMLERRSTWASSSMMTDDYAEEGDEDLEDLEGRFPDTPRFGDEPRA